MLDVYQKLSQEVRYDENTGQLWWLKTGTGRKFHRAIGNARKDTRGLRVRFLGYNIRIHRFIWWLKTGEILSEDIEIDHKDGDFTNNRFSNLRKSNDSQNSSNRPAFKNNKLGIKGVCQVPSGKYLAYIYYGGKQHRLGQFNDIQDAINARLSAAKKVQGDFAYESRLSLVQNLVETVS